MLPSNGTDSYSFRKNVWVLKSKILHPIFSNTNSSMNPFLLANIFDVSCGNKNRWQREQIPMTSFGGHSHTHHFPQKSMAQYQTTEMYSEAWPSNPVHFLGALDKSVVSPQIFAGYCKTKGKRKRVSSDSRFLLVTTKCWGRPRARVDKARGQIKSQRQETF